MKKYNSLTANGGTTILFDSLEEAIETGRDRLRRLLDEHRLKEPESTIKTHVIGRDKPVERINTTTAHYLKSLEERTKQFELAVKAILAGDDAVNQSIMDKADELVELVTAVEPSLAASYAGFERSEEGIIADVGLLASGDDRPFFQRPAKGAISDQGRRGRAYRILLNTDLSWFGKPDDNAAVVGALVMCLQRFGPVELWIQQGWLGKGDKDGVTLFKLDFSQGFQPTQLAFWCGHELKDISFSFEINMALGRANGGSSKSAEIPADLFLRGDWMKVYGVNESFDNLMHTEKVDIMVKWIAETAMQVRTSNDEDDRFAS
jgi:hypothetical protein